MTDQQIAKWIDQLQGELDALKRIAGGSGGSTVTITPALESGVKVADYSIGDTTGSIYSPDASSLFCGIDSSNLLDSDSTTSFTNPVSYTATEKCFAVVTAKGANATAQSISLNGVTIAYFGNVFSNIIIPLVVGDIITSRTDSVADACDMRIYIYGVRNEIPPIESTKRRKK